MRKILMGAVAALAVAVPASAFADTRGAIDLSYSDSDFDYGDFWDLELGALLLHDMSSGWTLQAEGRTTLQDWDCCGQYSHSFAAVHGSSDMGGWDLGGFVGILNYYGDGAPMLGVEARTAFGNFSVDGSLSYADFDGDYDGTAVRVGGAYFFTPNFALTGGVSRTDIETSFQDYEITELALGGAYQFANNITLFGGYTNTDGDRSVGVDYDGDTIQIGLRFNLNGGTLQENTNDGAWQSAARFADTWKRW
jgi:hypothetical protein